MLSLFLLWRDPAKYMGNGLVSINSCIVLHGANFYSTFHNMLSFLIKKKRQNKGWFFLQLRGQSCDVDCFRIETNSMLCPALILTNPLS